MDFSHISFPLYPYCPHLILLPLPGMVPQYRYWWLCPWSLPIWAMPSMFFKALHACNRFQTMLYLCRSHLQGLHLGAWRKQVGVFPTTTSKPLYLLPASELPALLENIHLTTLVSTALFNCHLANKLPWFTEILALSSPSLSLPLPL